jgi:hypothetical protein
MQAKVTRILSVLFVAAMISQSAVAQKYRPLRDYVEPDGWSIGMNIGKSELWGDVGTKSPIDHFANGKYLDKVSFMGGIYGRYHFHPSLAIRFALNFGSVTATDEWNLDGVNGNGLLEGGDYVQRYLRAQTAKATIFEASSMVEITPRRINIHQRAFRRSQPYVAAGLGVFHYTPYSTIGNSTTYVKTYDLSLEGQGFIGADYPKRNSRWQPAIPLAVGYKWDLGERLNFAIEYKYRMTLFDQLDGVSGKYISEFEFNQNLSPADARTAILIADKKAFYNNSLPSEPGTLRGNPGNNDSYSTISFMLTFKVPSRKSIWWSNKKF